MLPTIWIWLLVVTLLLALLTMSSSQVVGVPCEKILIGA